MSQTKGLLVLLKASAISTDYEKQLLLLRECVALGACECCKMDQMPRAQHRHRRTPGCVTIIFVRAVRVAVDDAGFSVRGPASVSNAKVLVELLLQVQRVFLWTHKRNVYQYL